MLKSNNDWYVYSHGGINTGLFALDWIDKSKFGAGEVLHLWIRMQIRFWYWALKKVSAFLDIPLIASGGVGKLEHFYDGVAKRKANALLAPVFHFNEISIKEVKNTV